MNEDPTRRRGKIAQCPRAIREELCRRLDDGQQGPEILAWVNAVPEVMALLAAKFDGVAISDNNLSEWFKGGFQDWKRQQGEVEKTTNFAEFSLRLAKAAGGSISEGALAIAAGRVMSELEGAEGKALLNLVLAGRRLRDAELNTKKMSLAEDKIEIAREAAALDREKFERLVVGKFIDWAKNEEAVRVATSESPEIAMPHLLQMMFGPRPAATPG